MLSNTYPQMTTCWTAKPAKKGFFYYQKKQVLEKGTVFYVSTKIDVRERGVFFIYQNKPMLEKGIVVYLTKEAAAREKDGFYLSEETDVR